MSVKRCDIILPTCGQLDLIKDCIESLIKSTRYPVRLIAIDNGSSKETTDYLKDIAGSGRLDMILLEPGTNLGWIRSINLGLEHSKDSAYVSFQNDDTVFTDGWLEELVDIFEKDSKVGIINPEWEKQDGININQYAQDLKRRYGGETIDMDWCRGHCFVVKREVVDRLGGFDPIYIPVYYDDRDYSLKAIAAGYRCVKALGAFVDHVRNVTMKRTTPQKEIADLMERNGKIFYKRWGYPLRIVFVLRDLDGSKDLLEKVCADQNKVFGLLRKGSSMPYRHTNINVLEFGKPFFNIAAIAYIISNRSRKPQKKTDFVLTDDRMFYSVLRPFLKLVNADVIFREDVKALEKEGIDFIRYKKERSKRSVA